MKKNSLFLFALLIAAMTFLPACGEDDDNNGQPDDQAQTDDVATDELLSDADTAEPLPEYPEVTSTSNKVDDIANNLVFYDQDDVKWTLGHFYKEKKLIWLIFSAYDCPACSLEKPALPELYKPEYVEQGFEIIFIENGLLSGPQPSKEPTKIHSFRTSMLDEYGDAADFVYGYLKEQTIFNKFINQGYPVNVLINGKTMQIVSHQEGWDPSGVESMDLTIQYWLGEI